MGSVFDSDDFDSSYVPGTHSDITDDESRAADDCCEISKTLENLNKVALSLSKINRNETERNIQNSISILTQMFLQSRLNNNIKLENVKSKLINRLVDISDTMTAAEIASFLSQIQMAMNDDVNRAVGGGPVNKGIQVNINNQDNRVNNQQTNNIGMNVYAVSEEQKPSVQKVDNVSKIVEVMNALKTLGVPSQNQISYDPSEPINTELKSKEVVAEFVELNQKEDKEANNKILNEE